MTNYHIKSSGGSDTNNGLSYGTAFATIGKLLSVMVAGDTGYFIGGPPEAPLPAYGAINSDVNTIPAGTSWENAVTFRSYPGETAKIERFRFNNTNNTYVIITELLIDPNSTQDHCVHIISGADFIRVAACELRNSNSSAIFATNTASGFCEFLGNYIHHTGSNGILVRCPNCLIEGNNFGSTIPGHAIEIGQSGVTNLNNIVIHRNYIYGTGNGATDNAILMANGQNALIVNNIIAACTGDGIELGVDALNTNVYNNTIYSVSGTAVNILATNDGGNTVRNNIFNNNGVNSIVDARGDVVASHNVTANALFVDAANGDFRLTINSPAVNTGMNTALVPVDFLGTERPQGGVTDVGAFESFFASAAVPSRLQRGNPYARRVIGLRNVA